MKKLYNGSSLSILAIIVISLLLVFLFTHPRASAYLPGRSERQLSQFIEAIQQDKSINPQRYWQFREFYSLGSFSFDPTIVAVGESLKIVALPSDQNILLQFDSARLSSTDYIVKKDPTVTQEQQMSDIIAKINESQAPVSNLINEKDLVLQQLADTSYLLIFSKSIDEMKIANGFFNYNGEEKKLLENTFWLNVTYLK